MASRSILTSILAVFAALCLTTPTLAARTDAALALALLPGRAQTHDSGLADADSRWGSPSSAPMALGPAKVALGAPSPIAHPDLARFSVCPVASAVSSPG
jgi:hypothetical protein